MKKLLTILVFLIISSVNTVYASNNLTREEAIRMLDRYVPKESTTTDGIYFTDVSTDTFTKLQFFCNHQYLSCNKLSFFPSQDISLPAFLKLTFGTAASKYLIQLANTSLPSDITWYEPYIKGALIHGLISANYKMESITVEEANNILKKIDTLASFHFIPTKFFKGLVQDPSFLSIQMFNSSDEATKALTDTTKLLTDALLLRQTATDLSQKSDADTVYNIALKNQKKLKEISDEMRKHPIWYDKNYSDEDRQLFMSTGINELIGEGYYDYHTNPGYRKHNIGNSVDNAHLQILQPDEVFSYWDTMYNRGGGLGDIGNGWTISGGKEIWEWGGGLCGTATALFRGAWMAGLEIVERRNHSAYYSSLYGLKEIGLDATVYSTGPDLKFKNNTGHVAMMYIKLDDDRDEVWVQVLGTKPFASLTNVGPTRNNGYYVHTRTITNFDGTKTSEEVKSSYRKIY